MTSISDVNNPPIEHCQSCGRGRYLGRDAFFCECGEPFKTNLPELQALRRRIGEDCLIATVSAEGRTTWTAPHGWTQLAESALANYLQDATWLQVARSASTTKLEER